MKITIVYATQTGTANEVANRIKRESRRTSIQTSVQSADDFYFDDSQQCCIFIVSVVGQGEEPDSMKRLWQSMLKKSHKQLNHIQYAVFGLGDSSYLKYNFPAKKLHKRLGQLGAESLLELGLGDDQHPLGYDNGLDAWLIKLWISIASKFEIQIESESTSIPKSTFRLVFSNEVSNKECEPLSILFSGKVVKNERMTSHTHFQDVRDLAIECTDPNFRYDAGHVLVVKPKNIHSQVQEVIDYFKWNEIADSNFVIESNFPDVQVPIHYGNTLRQLLTHTLDILCIPKRYSFELLSHFTPDETHSAKLKDFSKGSGQNDLLDYCVRPRRTLFEVLQDFSSLDIPIDYLLDIIPEMKNRSFSIATAFEVHQKNIGLCVAVVKYKNLMVKEREGVCTRWMKSWEIGDEIRFSIEKGTMKSTDEDIPVILIGPGTGIAPIRSFLHKRISKGLHKNYLICGFRSEANDFLYKDEFKSLESQGKLTLFTAFSQDQAEKEYVQHVIKRNGELMWSLIQQKAVIYVSGNSKQMPDDVFDAFKNIMIKHGGMKRDDAVNELMRMKNADTYQQECWS